jgi:hypothetical protein
MLRARRQTASVGDDGIVIVDDQYAPLAEIWQR